eukprot:COSAG05_NODE_1077_length_5955_cov_2.032787_3_plen_105_part_00
MLLLLLLLLCAAQVFYTGDSAYSIAWLEMGNRSAADDQFDLAFTHMDTAHFNVFEERNYGGGGNLNFITVRCASLMQYMCPSAVLQRCTTAGQFSEEYMGKHAV